MILKRKNNKKFEASAPQLDTVIMVEEFIEEYSREYIQTELFKNLPKKMMWRTFKIILYYLENSNKMVINKDGTITWIWNPSLVEKYLKNKNLNIKI